MLGREKQKTLLDHVKTTKQHNIILADKCTLAVELAKTY